MYCPLKVPYFLNQSAFPYTWLSQEPRTLEGIDVVFLSSCLAPTAEPLVPSFKTFCLLCQGHWLLKPPARKFLGMKKKKWWCQYWQYALPKNSKCTTPFYNMKDQVSSTKSPDNLSVLVPWDARQQGLLKN